MLLLLSLVYSSYLVAIVMKPLAPTPSPHTLNSAQSSAHFNFRLSFKLNEASHDGAKIKFPTPCFNVVDISQMIKLVHENMQKSESRLRHRIDFHNREDEEEAEKVIRAEKC
jgi:hypothetical protein